MASNQRESLLFPRTASHDIQCTLSSMPNEIIQQQGLQSTSIHVEQLISNS